MPGKRITDSMILSLIDSGELTVDLDTARCAHNGKIKSATLVGRDDRNGTRFRYEICMAGHRRRTIIRSRLVWMAGAGRVVPPKHEIHHIDGDRYNDAWHNLVCLSIEDHAKLHKCETSKIPF